MPLRRISSLWTYFHKIVLPAIFVIGFFNTLLLWERPKYQPNNFPPDAFFYVMPVFFIIFTLWFGRGLKIVSIDEMNRCLRVSKVLNSRKEVSIPFSEIDDVSESIFSDPRRITIKLRNPTEFGQKIAFLGTYRFGGIFAGPHPIVAELQALAAQA